MKTKLLAFLEIFSIVIFVRIFIWAWSTTPLASWEWNHLRWNYFTHIIFILVPILILLLAKRSFKSYGLNLVVNWRACLKWGGLFAATLGVPSLFALIFGWLDIQIPKFWLSTLIFQIFMAGFGEEVLYRGYYQSRGNEAFGRPLIIGGMRFGIGLIVTSLLFGFAHVLNPFNPLQGTFDLDWVAGLVALQTGVFYGLVRDRTGNILTSAIIHGSTFWWDFIGDGSARWICMSVGWSISWVILIAIFSQTRLKDQDTQGSG